LANRAFLPFTHVPLDLFCPVKFIPDLIAFIILDNNSK
jgi:hypothetical protein